MGGWNKGKGEERKGREKERELGRLITLSTLRCWNVKGYALCTQNWKALKASR